MKIKGDDKEDPIQFESDLEALMNSMETQMQITDSLKKQPKIKMLQNFFDNKYYLTSF